MDVKERLAQELHDLPEPLLAEVVSFVRFLKQEATAERLETALLSESALGKDWLRPEEDEALVGEQKGDAVSASQDLAERGELFLSTIKVMRLRANAKLPVKSSERATGFDLFACIEEPITVGERPLLVPTGLAMEIPSGYDGQIRPRSGLGSRGVMVALGTIDSDYRGELLVTMYTVGDQTHIVQPGDRIAQLVVNLAPVLVLSEAAELTSSLRGAGRHGSTGR